MSKKIVHVPHVAQPTEIGPVVRADQHPVRVYLASLEVGSRPAMRSGLHAIARLVNAELDAFSLPWADLRFQHTAAIRAALVSKYQPRTTNRMLASVRGVLKSAWRLGQMTTDDYYRAIDLRGAKVSGKPSGRAIPEGEFAKLVRVAQGRPHPISIRDQALLVLLYKGGLRREEVSLLNVDSMRSDKRTLDVWGKGKKHRFMYMSEGNWRWVEPWIDLRRVEIGAGAKGAPLFVSFARGRHGERIQPSGVHHVVAQLADDAGVKNVGVHDMRRSFATAMLDAGVDLLQLQSLMGHADLKTTKLYDRRGEDGKRKAVELLPVLDINKEDPR